MMQRFPARHASGAAVLALILALGALPLIPAARPRAMRAQPADGIFIGRLESIDAVVGIVAREGGAVVAFVTDGRTTADWFRGGQNAQSAAGVVFTTPDGGRLQLLTGDGAPRGRYTTADGRVADFVTTTARGDAGLYRSEAFGIDGGTKVVSAGWVVTNAGEVRGMLTVRLEDGTTDMLLPLAPSTLDLATMYANLPGFGGVRVIKMGVP